MFYINEKGPYFHREFVFKNASYEKPLDVLLIKTLDSLDTIGAIPYILSNQRFDLKAFREGYLNGKSTFSNGARDNIKSLWCGLAVRFSETRRKKLIFRQRDILKAVEALHNYHLTPSKTERNAIPDSYRGELNILLNCLGRLIKHKRAMLNHQLFSAYSHSRE